MRRACVGGRGVGGGSAVQILAVLDRMDVLDFEKVASYVASLQQVGAYPSSCVS